MALANVQIATLRDLVYSLNSECRRGVVGRGLLLNWPFTGETESDAVEHSVLGRKTTRAPIVPWSVWTP